MRTTRIENLRAFALGRNLFDAFWRRLRLPVLGRGGDHADQVDEGDPEEDDAGDEEHAGRSLAYDLEHPACAKHAKGQEDAQPAEELVSFHNGSAYGTHGRD